MIRPKTTDERQPPRRNLFALIGLYGQPAISSVPLVRILESFCSLQLPQRIRYSSNSRSHITGIDGTHTARKGFTHASEAFERLVATKIFGTTQSLPIRLGRVCSWLIRPSVVRALLSEQHPKSRRCARDILDNHCNPKITHAIPVGVVHCFSTSVGRSCMSVRLSLVRNVVP